MYKFNVLQDDIYFSGKVMTMEDKDLFIGNWVEPIPGAPKSTDNIQGFTLKLDGSASSINMATLVYQSWMIYDGKLILTAKSIGNGNSSISKDEYKIDSVGKNQLYLKQGKTSYIYRRKK